MYEWNVRASCNHQPKTKGLFCKSVKLGRKRVGLVLPTSFPRQRVGTQILHWTLKWILLHPHWSIRPGGQPPLRIQRVYKIYLALICLSGIADHTSSLLYLNLLTFVLVVRNDLFDHESNDLFDQFVNKSLTIRTTRSKD
jgi:hypothetical protein